MTIQRDFITSTLQVKGQRKVGGVTDDEQSTAYGLNREKKYTKGGISDIKSGSTEMRPTFSQWARRVSGRIRGGRWQ
jgi:hypothetical protein